MTSSCEPFSVGQGFGLGRDARRRHASNGGWVGTEATGAYAYDTATVTGAGAITPTGSVTYSFYATAPARATPPRPTPRISRAAPSPTPPRPPPWRPAPTASTAAYSGDANYSASTSSCEPSRWRKLRPRPALSSTTPPATRPGAATEATGATAYDTSSVDGVEGFTPTGSVTYSFFDNGTCSGMPPRPTPRTLRRRRPQLRHDGRLGAGSYSFAAAYSGDANYSASTSSCEPFGVAQASASTGTVVDDATSNAPWGGDEVTGATAYDTSTLTGVEGFTPTGTVTYSFFANGTCSGDAATTDTGTLATAPSATPPRRPPSAAGAYSFDGEPTRATPTTRLHELLRAFSVAKLRPRPGRSSTTPRATRPGAATEATGASAYDTSTLTG